MATEAMLLLLLLLCVCLLESNILREKKIGEHARNVIDAKRAINTVVCAKAETKDQTS